MSLEGLKMVFQMLIQTQIENPQNTIWPFNHQELVSVSGFPNSFNLVLMNSDFLTAFFPLPHPTNSCPSNLFSSHSLLN